MGTLSEILLERMYTLDFILISGISLFILILSFFLVRSIYGTLKSAWLLNAFLVYYVEVVLCYTVLCRKMGELTQFQPMPFYNLCDGNTPLSRFLYEGLLNMVLFIPIGLITGVAGWKRWKIISGALLLSLVIEAMQWFLKCGCCETNDVINNLIGSFLGLFIAGKTWKKN